jgi:hypothetical protein
MKSDRTSNTPQQGTGQSLNDFGADPRWRHGKIVRKVSILETNLALTSPIIYRIKERFCTSLGAIMVSVLLSWPPTEYGECGPRVFQRRIRERTVIIRLVRLTRHAFR